MKSRARSLAVALLAGVFVGLTGTVAVAAVASSDWKNVVVIDGIQHSNRSAIENPPKRGVATARASLSVGGGRLGASAYVASESGAICASAGVAYSTYATASFSRYTSTGACGAGNHRSWGVTYHYVPSTGTYNTYSTYYSPYQGW